jgi:hypothetical protein
MLRDGQKRLHVAPEQILRRVAPQNDNGGYSLCATMGVEKTSTPPNQFGG